MSAVEVLRLARENGVRLGVAGADLILDADREPAPRVGQRWDSGGVGGPGWRSEWRRGFHAKRHS